MKLKEQVQVEQEPGYVPAAGQQNHMSVHVLSIQHSSCKQPSLPNPTVLMPWLVNSREIQSPNVGMPDWLSIGLEPTSWLSENREQKIYLSPSTKTHSMRDFAK